MTALELLEEARDLIGTSSQVRQMKTAYELLTDARKLIETPEQWTRGTIARNEYDLATHDVFAPSTCKFCLFGAITKAAGQNIATAWYGFRGSEALDQAAAVHELGVAVSLLHKSIPSNSIGQFNDRSTHDEVMAALDAAIEMAKERP